MALLVQRVSGVCYGPLFYPAGGRRRLLVQPVRLEPRTSIPTAGMLRLVFGLGTRAVDRADDDYTRIVALNAPERRPEATSTRSARTPSARWTSSIWRPTSWCPTFSSSSSTSPRLPIEMFASHNGGPVQPGDGEQRANVARLGADVRRAAFTAHAVCHRYAGDAVAALQEAYDWPVDVEFTANFLPERIRSTSCSATRCKSPRRCRNVELPKSVSPDDRVLEARGAVIGQSRSGPDRPVGLRPAVGLQANCRFRDRYSIARLIGHLIPPRGPRERGRRG